MHFDANHISGFCAQHVINVNIRLVAAQMEAGIAVPAGIAAHKAHNCLFSLCFNHFPRLAHGNSFLSLPGKPAWNQICHLLYHISPKVLSPVSARTTFFIHFAVDKDTDERKHGSNAKCNQRELVILKAQRITADGGGNDGWDARCG